MTLVRWRPRREWDPFAGLLDLHREFSNIFAPLAPGEGELGHWAPPVNVYSDEGRVVVEAEVPGMKQEEIEVDFHDNVLTIKGERKHEAETKEEGYHRVERCYGSFHRAIRLPAEVDGSKAKAELKEGVLTITFPKAEEAKARKIKIEPK
jgi:HSP20 family protein